MISKDILDGLVKLILGSNLGEVGAEFPNSTGEE